MYRWADDRPTSTSGRCSLASIPPPTDEPLAAGTAPASTADRHAGRVGVQPAEEKRVRMYRDAPRTPSGGPAVPDRVAFLCCWVPGAQPPLSRPTGRCGAPFLQR